MAEWFTRLTRNQFIHTPGSCVRSSGPISRQSQAPPLFPGALLLRQVAAKAHNSTPCAATSLSSTMWPMSNRALSIRCRRYSKRCSCPDARSPLPDSRKPTQNDECHECEEGIAFHIRGIHRFVWAEACGPRACCYSWSVKRNSRPPPLRLRTEMVPPCICTALRTMLRPRPVPPASRVRPSLTR